MFKCYIQVLVWYKNVHNQKKKYDSHLEYLNLWTTPLTFKLILHSDLLANYILLYPTYLKQEIFN